MRRNGTQVWKERNNEKGSKKKEDIGESEDEYLIEVKGIFSRGALWYQNEVKGTFFVSRLFSDLSIKSPKRKSAKRHERSVKQRNVKKKV